MNPDFCDILSAFNEAGVEYLVVGAWHRSRNKSRLSLRERPAFRGAKGDNQTVIPRTILMRWPPTDW